MYDTIDINNNKKFYNFNKLDKLVSYKNLLYNSILIYYIIYNKINNSNKYENRENNDNLDKKSIKSNDINKIINNTLIFNNYEKNYLDLYNQILYKFNNLEEKLNFFNSDETKDLLNNLKNLKNNLNLHIENEKINKSNNTIDKHNQYINEYNSKLKKNNTNKKDIDYLINLINNLKNNNNEKSLVDKYEAQLKQKKQNEDKLILRIDELNNIIKNYISENNTYIENNELLNKQIETLNIYIEENKKKIKLCEEQIKLYKHKNKIQTDTTNKIKNKINNFQEKLNKLYDKSKKITDENLKNNIDLQINKLKTSIGEKENLQNIEKNNSDLYLSQIEQLRNDLDKLNKNKLELLKSIDNVKKTQETLLVSQNEKDYIDNLYKDKEKNNLDSKKLLSELKKDRFIIDIDDKLKEKLELEKKLSNLTAEIKNFYNYKSLLDSINNNNNKIINNINSNIKKINSCSNNIQKNSLIEINNNLKKTLNNNNQLFEDNIIKLEEYLITIIPNNNKINILQVLFNIFDIDTEINILNNLLNDNEVIERKCEHNIKKNQTINLNINNYNKKFKDLTTKNNEQVKLIKNLESNNILTTQQLKNLKNMVESLELDNIYKNKNELLYKVDNKLSDINRNLQNNLSSTMEENIELKEQINQLNSNYLKKKQQLQDKNKDLENLINEKIYELDNSISIDEKLNLKKQIRELEDDRSNILNEVRKYSQEKQSEYLKLISDNKQQNNTIKNLSINEKLILENNKNLEDFNKTLLKDIDYKNSQIHKLEQKAQKEINEALQAIDNLNKFKSSELDSNSNKFLSETSSISTQTTLPTIEPSSIPTQTTLPTIEPSSIPTQTTPPTILPSNISTQTILPTIEPSSIPTQTVLPNIETSSNFTPTLLPDSSSSSISTQTVDFDQNEDLSKTVFSDSETSIFENIEDIEDSNIDSSLTTESSLESDYIFKNEDIGKDLIYIPTKEIVQIIKIHYEDKAPYYTIKMSDGREKQTTSNFLKLLDSKIEQNETEEEDPTGEEEVPTGEEEVPTGEEEDPTGEEEDPTGEEEDPTGEEEDPTGEEEVPTGEEEVPTGEEDPTGEEEVPAGEEEVPAGEEEVPAGEEEVPAGEEEVPAGEEEVPAGEEEVPAGEEEVPAGEEEVPAGEEEVPAGEEEVPAGEEEVPAGEEEVPVLTDEQEILYQRLFTNKKIDITNENMIREQIALLSEGSNFTDIEDLLNYTDGNTVLQQSFLQGNENDFNKQLNTLHTNLTTIYEKFNQNKMTKDRFTRLHQFYNNQRTSRRRLKQDFTEEDIMQYMKMKQIVQLMYIWLHQYNKLRYNLQKKQNREQNPNEISEAARDQIGLMTLFPMSSVNDLHVYPEIELEGFTYFNRELMIDYLQILSIKRSDIDNQKTLTNQKKWYELLFIPEANPNSLIELNPSLREYVDAENLQELYIKNEHLIEDKTRENKNYTSEFTDYGDSEKVVINYLGGKNTVLIDNKIIDFATPENKTNLSILINKINNKFKDLLESFCVNCTQQQKINKLNELFKLNEYNEQKLYDKYNITVRDLNLYIYLNILDFIINEKLNKKYKNLLVNTLEDIIIEHINYSIWLFLYSKTYTYELFNKNIENGLMNIDPIIEYIRTKEKLKFNRISVNIFKKYFNEILKKYLLNIKTTRDYYNEQLIYSTKYNKLLNKYKNNKYDYSYLTKKNKMNNIYDSLNNISKIKYNLNINKNRYNKNISELLNSTINIIILYKNLYLFIKNIYKFFSINNLRTISEVSIIINNFKKYLDISNFLKEHNISKDILSNELSKLIKQINTENDLQDLSIQWDLLDIKLTKLNKFSNFEIECIKLIIAIKYNEYLLTNVNNYIKLYNINKNKFIKILNKFNINYKNMSRFHKNLQELGYNYVGIDFYTLINFNNNLKYLI